MSETSKVYLVFESLIAIFLIFKVLSTECSVFSIPVITNKLKKKKHNLNFKIFYFLFIYNLFNNIKLNLLYSIGLY